MQLLELLHFKNKGGFSHKFHKTYLNSHRILLEIRHGCTREWPPRLLLLRNSTIHYE